MKTLLVTGGAGFIGGNFILEMLDLTGYRIINLDALTYAGNPDTLAEVARRSDYIFEHGDIGDRERVQGIIANFQPTAIINFAAESHVDRSIDGPAQFVQTNVVGTLNLLECALAYWRALPLDRQDAFRFLQVSTDEVYGSLGPVGRFTEESPYQPNSPYSASKASSDHLVRAFHHTYGLPVLTATYATGCTSRTTAQRSCACSRSAGSARSTTLAATPSARTSMWSRLCAACSTNASRWPMAANANR